MVVRKTTSRKPRYQITASYSIPFSSRTIASQVVRDLKAKTKAIVGKTTKTSKGYTIHFKFVANAMNATDKNKMVNGAKRQGAKVSIKNL